MMNMKPEQLKLLDVPEDDSLTPLALERIVGTLGREISRSADGKSYEVSAMLAPPYRGTDSLGADLVPGFEGYDVDNFTAGIDIGDSTRRPYLKLTLKKGGGFIGEGFFRRGENTIVVKKHYRPTERKGVWRAVDPEPQPFAPEYNFFSNSPDDGTRIRSRVPAGLFEALSRHLMMHHINPPTEKVTDLATGKTTYR
jgi:hypothetical protein